MLRSVARRALVAMLIAVPLTISAQAPDGSLAAGGQLSRATAAGPGGLSAADVARLARDATQRVIVVLRDQHADLANRGATRASRLAALASEQAPILAELAQVGAPRVRAYHLVNAVAATVSAAEMAHLRANALVQAVVPDRVVREPRQAREHAQAQVAASPVVTGTSECSTSLSLEPEALQLTHTAFLDPSVPQAQNIVTGKGVTVAWIADGLDPNVPDFIRPDGSHVFVDYQDFSGDGPNAPTAGGEAFGDASSIAAQGIQTYDINAYVQTVHQRPAPATCPIKIRGMAPGAALIGLKAFNAAGESFTSALVQSIEYAVDHGADVINESFGANPYPDNAIDPISLADAAAVAAGVTVVSSTGDAGTAGTVGTPATDPWVIAAGATTQFRLYAQVDAGGIQLGSGGYESDNISSFSSAGIAEGGRKTVDVVAPGDLGWALCSTNTDIYGDCFDYNGNPAPIQVFGGTSESAPLTAGEAALVIEAYRRAHGGASPSPALVKQIIKSTATDLGIPSYEQGAGLINSLKAVQAALSFGAATTSAARQGNALLTAPDLLAATANPNTVETFPIQVTNDGATVQTVRPLVRTLGAPSSHASYTATLDPATDPIFLDTFGLARAYVEQVFTVPAGAQRLDAAIAWDVVGQPFTLVRLSLFDPQNRLAAYSAPQDAGPPITESGYGHVDVRFPMAGTWRAIIWTRASAAGYSGPVHLDVSTSRFTLAGLVVPATRVLLPGQIGTFTVVTRMPAQPGDLNAEVAINGTDAVGRMSSAGTIPLILRSLVPLGPTGGAFSGVLTGGNGRGSSPGQILTYQFDVPSGLRDLGLSLGITDPNYNLEGVLVDPNGLPLDEQSTVTALDPGTGLPTAYTNRLQFFRRDPQAGRWKFILFINNNISGAQTALPFLALIRFNTVRVQAPSIPNNPGVVLAHGQPVVIPVTIANTGVVTKDLFVDPRLAQTTLLSLGSVSATLQLNITSPTPAFFVPPETTELTIAAESIAPSVPISMDIVGNDGAPPYGTVFVSNPGAPDIEATSFLDPFSGNYAAVADTRAPELTSGQWLAYPTEVGPYPDAGAPPSIAQVAGVAVTQQLDTAVSSSTGDEYAILTGQPSSPYTPLTLAPGATGTIDVTITPNAPAGTVVHGFLYVDTFATSGGLPITNSGDELIAIPYSYTVGASATPAR